MTPKPIVATASLTEFGDPSAEDIKEITTPGGPDYDRTFVPGFSDLRIKRDLAVAEHRAGRISSADVPNLPANIRWVRCASKEGNDNTKVFGSGTNGYKLVSKDDVGEGKTITKMPGGAVQQADGTIRLGDCVLMITDNKTAARNAARKIAETERRMTGAMEIFEQRVRGLVGPKGQDADDGSGDRQAAVTAQVLKGAQPYITKTEKK